MDIANSFEIINSYNKRKSFLNQIKEVVYTTSLILYENEELIMNNNSLKYNIEFLNSHWID